MAASIKRFLPKSAFTRNVATISAGLFASQALVALVAPIATRFYTPEDYGILGVFTSITGVILLISTGRYEMAVPIPEDDKSAINLLSVAFLVNVFTAAAVSLIVWLGAKPFLAMINATALAPYVWLVPLSVIGGGAYKSLSYWAVRTKSYNDLAATKLHQSIGGSATLLGLGFLHAGPIGLLLGQFISTSAGVSRLGRLLFRDAGRQVKSIRWNEMRALAVRHKQFPLISSPSALLNGAAFFLPPLLIAALYSTREAGLFSLAMRMVSIPASLIGVAVTQVYLGAMADAARNDRKQLIAMFSSTTRKLMKLGVPVILLGFACPFIFGTVFGREWQAAGLYTTFLSIHAAAQLVVSPVSTVAIVLGRQDLQFVGDLTRCILVLLSLLVPYWLMLPAIAAVASYSGIMFLTYAGFYFIYRWVAFNAKVVEEMEAG